MWEQLRRFRKLESPAQKLFLRAMVLLPLVTLSLRWRGFRATKTTLQKFLPKAIAEQNADAPRERAALTVRMVYAADRHGSFHPSCLAKSLTLWWLLGRQGIRACLRIGVRREREAFEAHAWVECEGVALNEPEERHHHYSAFDEALSSLPGDEE